MVEKRLMVLRQVEVSAWLGPVGNLILIVRAGRVAWRACWVWGQYDLRVGEVVRGPSRTAVLTAVARALHREEPRPWVIDDYLALGLAGREGRALLGRLRAEVPGPYLLAFSRWMC